MKKYKVLDWYVHQGHQYEFFKLNHDFYLVAPSGKKPEWNAKHRPLNKNVHLISLEEAKKMSFDIVIIRTPISSQIYRPFIKRGAAPIAVIQTTDPIWLPREVKHVVWNSHNAMKRRLGFYKLRHQHFIVHGFDPDEFTDLKLERNDRVLTVANHFKQRANIMGFDIWKKVESKVKRCDILGSKNEEISGALPHSETFEELLNYYNTYEIYFNPTRSSAMPRSRAEAAMCGMPIVSTMYYDIARFFKPGRDALISNNIGDLRQYIINLRESPQMREDFGGRAREIAIKKFHINNFLTKWQQIMDRAVSE